MTHRIDRSVITEGPNGAIAHRELIEHSRLFEPQLHHVSDGIWCHVGGGLSNVTFVEAPEGLIVIDSGECREEAAAALAAVRAHTDAPIAAMIWSHYHYVQGTAVYTDEAGADLPIWSHVDSVRLLGAVGADVGPSRLRGLVSQFGLSLPTEGPDSMPNVGLGPFFRDPIRERSTPGFVPSNRHVDSPTDVTIAGEPVVLTPVPSDSEDTLVIWFPERGVCVNNHLWPALFNIFPLRGETYRDPQVLLEAFDLMLDYEPEHLVGVHGPPISGRAASATALADYRDSIQFIWDQTIRHMNAGHSLGEIVDRVRLPERFREAYYTSQFYGMVPHHVRQIHAGVRGWFDGDSANLFPLSDADEAARIVEGFGGRDVVVGRTRAALDADDAAWAAQLATYLLRLDRSDGEARQLKADALRLIARTVTSANVRSWCLTEARELEGSHSLDRYRSHITSARRVLGASPHVFVHALRVQTEPDRARFETGVEWRFTDSGATAALRVRHGVAIPADADPGADVVLELDLATWAALYAGEITAAGAEESGGLRIEGDRNRLAEFFTAFDQPHLANAFGP